MFLLLAPSLLTGKRPGLYCPGGRRSQDAPKGPKGEVRGWIVRHDKELTPPPSLSLLRTHPLKNKTLKLASFFSLLSQRLSFQIPVIIKSFRKLNQDNAPADYFILNILIAFSSASCVRALFLACVLCISLMERLSPRAFPSKKWEIQSEQLTEE